MSADQTHNRRKFLAGVGLVAAAGAAAAANAQEAGHSHHGNSGFTPAGAMPKTVGWMRWAGFTVRS